MELENCLKWTLIETLPIENDLNFWKAILLSVTKPHLINRRLAGAQQISVYQSNTTDLNIVNRIANYVQQPIDFDEALILHKILQETQTLDHFHPVDTQFLSECDFNRDKLIFVILSKCLPKNLQSHKNTFEITILDSVRSEVTFLNLLNNQTTGFIKCFTIKKIEKEHGSIEMIGSAAKINHDDEMFERQSNWIKRIILPKLSKWMMSMDENYDKKSTADFSSIESLSLINISEYNELYNALKVKYGEHMVKIWPEQTDASKFVYEDVAIATYLILLWREERRHSSNSDQLQSFVDLGCGNGLLVYILSGEGHQGYGIDVRKRGIWDLYPSETVLKVQAIVPSVQSLFPGIDWIIGNHSDELSPWIPVISARSSYKSRYFLLPCCAFEFNGKKFQRRCSTISQYMDFLSYTQQISEICGFRTKIDRLKIPSTKRICLIGYERNYLPTEQTTKDAEIQKFINANQSNIANDNWHQDFQPRSDVEKVQNCTKVDKNIQNDIIEIVFGELIKKKRYCSSAPKPNWNIGGRISLNDLVKLLPSDKLKALKSECGGLQTLLKNHSQVFHVANGTVEIRLPIKWSDKKRELEAKGVKIQLKAKKCWFHSKHPDGCPLPDDECSFVH